MTTVEARKRAIALKKRFFRRSEGKERGAKTHTFLFISR